MQLSGLILYQMSIKLILIKTYNAHKYTELKQKKSKSKRYEAKLYKTTFSFFEAIFHKPEETVSK